MDFTGLLRRAIFGVPMNIIDWLHSKFDPKSYAQLQQVRAGENILTLAGYRLASGFGYSLCEFCSRCMGSIFLRHTKINPLGEKFIVERDKVMVKFCAYCQYADVNDVESIQNKSRVSFQKLADRYPPVV
jgi:hypothetical protein